MSAVIEVDDVKSLIVNQYVAWVKVTMQSYFSRAAGALKTGLDSVEDMLGNTVISVAIVVWDKIILDKVVD